MSFIRGPEDPKAKFEGVAAHAAESGLDKFLHF